MGIWAPSIGTKETELLVPPVKVYTPLSEDPFTG